MESRIETLNECLLIGKSVEMSFAENKTATLWQSFMANQKLIKNRVGDDYFSVEIYSSTDFFIDFKPTKRFTKWAAVKVEAFEDIPKGMEKLLVPKGTYAVFLYKGSASNAAEAYRYIFTEWLPKSPYELDDRPHMAIMGEKYKNNDVASEEEIWIPVR